MLRFTWPDPGIPDLANVSISSDPRKLEAIAEMLNREDGIVAVASSAWVTVLISEAALRHHGLWVESRGKPHYTHNTVQDFLNAKLAIIG